MSSKAFAPCGDYIGSDNNMNACVSGWTNGSEADYCKTHYSKDTQPDEFAACTHGAGK